MSDNKVTMEELQAQLAALQAENDSLKEKKVSQISCKVSQKGAVSLYGLQRFPVTLYANQWERLLGSADSIREFITANASSLAHKD